MDERTEMDSEKRRGTDGAEEETTDLSSLPGEVLAHILSLTTPSDACRASAVCWSLHAAAQSNIVWERFLPSDYDVLISPMKPTDLDFDPISSSKKAIYFSLCDCPLLIDGGKKSFSLDLQSGKKCIMLGARDMSIVRSDTPFYWNWESHHGSRFKISQNAQNPMLYLVSFPLNSNTFVIPFNVGMRTRFPEVAVLREAWWLEVSGKISCRMLSPATTYASYFVFKIKICKCYGFDFGPVFDAKGIVVDFEFRTKIDCLDHYLDNPRWWHQRISLAESNQPKNIMSKFEYPRTRSDGWLEIELGEFKTDGEYDEVEIFLKEVDGYSPQSGIIVQGIEIRPKIGGLFRWGNF